MMSAIVGIIEHTIPCVASLDAESWSQSSQPVFLGVIQSQVQSLITVFYHIPFTPGTPYLFQS